MEASLVGRIEVLSAIYLSVQSIYLHLRTLHLILGFYQKKYLGASIPSSTPLQHKLSMDIDRKLAWVCTYFKLLRPHRSTIALPSVLALAALVLLDAAMHVFAARNRKHWGDQMKMERKTGHWNEEKQRTRDCRLGKGNSQERRCAGAGCCWMWSR